MLCFRISVCVVSKESTALSSGVARDLNCSYFFANRLLKLMQLLFKNEVPKSQCTNTSSLSQILAGERRLF